MEPEKKLMLAILEDAVACLQKYCLASDKRRRGLFRETEEWLMEENNDSIFSFENICETLGFSPQYIRQGLLRWKEMKLAGTRPKTNVYRLTSRAEKKKARSQMAVTPEQKFSKVAGS
ncbi:MAG: hypothetical protein HY695_38780 [Deltaproteobacteria bacterium]|nr:hypothetical protein [Deltaproteobacteria bacterium]